MDQTPFRSALSTNYVPTDRECEKITKFLSGQKLQLAELRGKIAEQEAILQKLKEEYQDLEGNISAHRALISPCRRLPDDILREIFVHCLPLNRNPAMHAAGPPFLLAHVCGCWRQVAFPTPRLWSSLHISNYPDGAQIPNSQLESRDDRTLQWIGRAGTVPLSLSFSTPRMDRSDSDNRDRRSTDMKRLFSLLSSSFSRWKKLEVSLDGLEDDLFQIAKLQDEGGRTPFDQVEQLTIRVNLRHDRAVSRTDHQYKVQMLLREFRLNCNVRLQKLGLYFDHKDIFRTESLWLTEIIPHSQLEVLDLQGLHLPHEGCEIPIDILPSILQAYPKLAILKADIGKPRPAFPWSISTTKMGWDRLKQASLSFPDWDSLTLAFIEKWDWPSLTSLYLRKRASTYNSAYLLSSVADRFSSTLTSLRLSPHSDISQKDLIKFMFALPKLVQLHLEPPTLSRAHHEAKIRTPYDENSVVTEVYNVITHLTPTPDGTPHALPQLRFLKWEMNTGFSDKALAHLLQQRFTSPYSPSPMEQVHITFGRPMQDDILPACSNLIDAGLDLRLVYPPKPAPVTLPHELMTWSVEGLYPLKRILGA